MKFRCINVHNLKELVPAWAIDPFALAKTLEGTLSQPEARALVPVGEEVYKGLSFWIEVDAVSEPPSLRVCTPDDAVDLSGHLIITCHSKIHDKAQIDLPLNPIFKGYERIAGRHTVYLHSFQTEVPLGYTGITKNRWFDRYSQHIASAKAGSSLLFHKALIKHQDLVVLHKVFFCDLEYENALEQEEDIVRMFSLYPLGLNMIPGGKAGFEYLGKLGVKAKNSEERDLSVEELSSRESLSGRPNPLCAARWETDPDYAERVICGHSGRLTAEQVRLVRLGVSCGMSPPEIASDINASSVQQVRNIISGKTYGRVK